MSSSANQALASLARAEARANKGRAALITTAIAMPVAILAAWITVVIGSTLDENVALLWLSLIVSPTTIIWWLFVAGFLFLVSVASFAVGDRQAANTRHLLRVNGASQTHQQRLALVVSMIPGTLGVIVGSVVGAAVGIAISEWLGQSLTVTHLATLPLGLAVPGLVAWLGVVAGAWWPTRNSDKQQPLVSPATVDAAWPRRAVKMTAISFAVLVAAALYYNVNRVQNLIGSGGESIAATALMVATLTFIAGIVSLLPNLVALVATLGRSGPGWLRFALGDLARHRGRSGKAAGAAFALTVLTVMGVAGIKSDEDWHVPLDGHYVVVESARPQLVAPLAEILANDDAVGAVSQVTFEQRLVYLEERRGDTIIGQERSVALVDDGLAQALQLSQREQDDLASGTVLINSRSRLFDNAAIIIGQTTVNGSRRIEGGEGATTALALLMGQDAYESITNGGANPSPGMSRRGTAFVTEAPLTRSTRQEIQEVAIERSEYVAIRDADLIEIGLGVPMALTMLAAGLAVIIGFTQARLTDKAEQSTLRTVGDLGANPTVQRLIRSSQAGLQQLIAAVTGAAIGVVLFRVVTWGDPTVPNVIVPWPTIAVLVLAVPAIIATLTGLLGRPPGSN